MGWFSKVVASTAAFISAAKDATVSAAQATWSTLKKTAAKVVTWVAVHGESTVAKAKDLWKAAKPYVESATAGLHAAGVAHPLIKKVAIVLDALLALEKSPALKWVDKAVTWVIALAKHLNDAMLNDSNVELTEEERAKAEFFQESFRDATGSFTGAHAEAMSVAAMVNDLVLAQDRIARLVRSGEVVDVDHFLRLRAAQKLVSEATQRYAGAGHEQDVSHDDIFLVRVAGDLLKTDPALSSEDAQRLDALLVERHGRGLLPYAFEELLPAWKMRLEQLEERWNALNHSIARGQILLRRLEFDKSIAADGRLTDEEQAQLDELQSNLPSDRLAFVELGAEKLALAHHLHAAEGFMQVLEKSPEELDAAGMGYVRHSGEEVGKLIIQGAEQGKPWDQFTPEEQALIIDFANIFEQACNERVQRLVKVAA